MIEVMADRDPKTGEVILPHPRDVLDARSWLDAGAPALHRRTIIDNTVPADAIRTLRQLIEVLPSLHPLYCCGTPENNAAMSAEPGTEREVYFHFESGRRRQVMTSRGRFGGRILAAMDRTCGQCGQSIAACTCTVRTSADPPTHRCKICGALWRLNPADPKYPAPHPFSQPSWTWVRARDSPEHLGKCCDNVAMGDQIERL